MQLRFEKYDLVICDEFGYVSCDKEGGELLFNHLSLRAGKKATIITTNLAFNRWNEIIAENGAYPPNQNGLIHPQLSLKWA